MKENNYPIGAAFMTMFEKVLTFAISIILIGTTISYGQWDTVFVDQSRPANGDGQSWNNAFNNLDTALCYGTDTNVIVLCAEGTYYPDPLKKKFSRTGNRRFKLIGGYPIGCISNTTIPQDNYRVTLSGDLQRDDIYNSDSTFTIVGNNANTVLEFNDYCKIWLERVTIQCGNNVSDTGAGLRVRDTANIIKCNFISNSAFIGGAIFGYDRKPSKMIINSCFFKDNRSTDTSGREGDHSDELSGGGAVFVMNTFLQIQNSKFFENYSENAGGAICIHNSRELVSENNLFIACTSGSFGGAIYARINIVSSINDSIISNRSKRSGGGMLFYGDSVHLENNSFYNNQAKQHGGAMVLGCNGEVIKCKYLYNNADSSGGAMYVNSNSDYGIVIKGNVFERNRSEYNGGAMFILDGPFSISDSTFFTRNRASNNGGAIFIDSGVGLQLKLNKIIFNSDSAENGGAIFSQCPRLDSSYTSNCIFKNNIAESKYAVCLQNGGVYKNCSFFGNKAGIGYIISGSNMTGSGPEVNECTIADNFVPTGKEILENIPLIKNTILWNDSGIQVGDSCITVKYSLIKNWSGGGEGNISNNPKFALDSTDHAYRIRGGSPAINSGDSNISNIDSVDLSGDIRVYGRRIDIGAYECHHGRIYVDSRAIGNNNGSSWGHAYTDLHEALYYAVAGDTIWVAKGVYKADNGYGYRTIYFNVPTGVILIGGFKGDEKELSLRDWKTNITILSGEMGSPASMIDNSYRIITVAPNSIVDGFTITRGCEYSCLIDKSDNVIIRNCILSYNTTADDWAAINIRNSNNVLIEKCFINNNSVYGPGDISAAGIGAYRCTNLRIRNCIFTGNDQINKSNASAALFNHCSLNINNCTFGKNNKKTLIFDTSTVYMSNNIIWNDSTESDTVIHLDSTYLEIDYCDIRTGISGIKYNSFSAINAGEKIYNLNPDFTDIVNNDLSLTRTSPCIDRGINIDTSGWGFDFDGNKRIHNGIIDIGALEYQGIPQPEAPVILSELNEFSIPANGSITIDLNRKKSDSTGYYVFYTYRDISELTWQSLSSDTNVKVLINPANNQMQISLSPAYRPGNRFSLRLRVADPDFMLSAAEKTVQFLVINPGFRVCELNIAQNDTGRFFEGSINVENTIDPIFLSRERIYLGDTIHGSIQDMEYIDGILLSETVRPASRGGAVNCGIYNYSFNATSVTVFNSKGISTGKTLYEWAKNIDSRSPASIYYKNHKKIKFIFSVTNGLSDAQEFKKEIPVDFDAPLTTIQVTENSAHRQIISWEKFKEPLSLLCIIIVPTGDSAPAPDTIFFDSTDLNITKYSNDSLQDSRHYNYFLKAKDKRGNTGVSIKGITTPSDYYTISGFIKSINIPVDTVIRINLYKSINDSTRELLVSEMVKLDTIFQFSKITNGKYQVELGSCGRYYAMPVKDSITIKRKSVSGLYYNVSPEPVANYDGIRVEQLENSGDLKFTVKTNILFIGEVPTKILLHWEGGDSAVDTGSQEFPISTFNKIANSDGSAIWSFIISRKQIEDSILSTKKGFTSYVRYYNSKLSTTAFGYPTFREAVWEYPVIKGRKILFAGQRFVKPTIPRITLLIPTTNGFRFNILNIDPGPGMKANVRLERFDSIQVINRTYFSSNTSKSFVYNNDKLDSNLIICPFDWNYSSRYKNDSKGRTFLSGLIIDSVGNDSNIAKIGTGFFNPDTVSKISDTVPYASWRINIPEKRNYWVWIYVDQKPKTPGIVNLSLGDVNTGKKLPFYVNKRGWVSLNAYLNINSGYSDVNLFLPENDISVSAIALKKRTFEGSAPNLSGDYRDSVPQWGGFHNRIKARDINNLKADTRYKMDVWVTDRYGNISDTVTFDTVQTLDSLQKGKLSVHENSGTGSLNLTLKEKITKSEYIDSIIFRLGGKDYSLGMHIPVSQLTETNIEISRSELKELVPVELFKRHTVYDSLFLVFSSDTIRIVETKFPYICNYCTGCDPTLHSINGLNYYRSNCIYQRYDTIVDIIQTSRIFYKWPDGKPYVSSQEYRDVTTPILTVLDTTARSIRLSCSNLNSNDTGGIKEQMSGKLNVKWRPGSTCEDTSFCSFNFGNQFKMKGNWIAFIPSFEGALNTNTGAWRKSDSLGARHQWIDRYDRNNPLLGGEFYPNIGNTISSSELFADRSRIPSISTGIFLTRDQASQNFADTTQKFHLWVLTSKVNMYDNDEFYWGIDGNPDTVTIGNVFTNDSSPSWKPGPSVYLSEGEHTIDLYMKEDGAGIAAIALSKDNVSPAVSLDSLSRWGDYGFDINFQVEELPSDKEITFTYEAIDRFGNTSGKKEQVIKTKAFDKPVPGVIISPDMALENGYYHSIYPSFTMSLSDATSDSLMLQTVLIYNNGVYSDSISRLDIREIDSASHIWQVAVDSSYALNPYPDSGGISSTNSYAIRARIIKSNGNTGDWTQLLFGVKADTSEIPPSVVIIDSTYETSALKFKFIRGVEVAADRIIGDLEINFDFENNSGKKLVLEGAVVYTDTSFDSGLVIHEKIDSIYGGKIACYECDEYSYNCSRSSVFSFPYGKYTVETFAESLSVYQYGSIKKIKSPISRIIDDNGSYVRLSSSIYRNTAVPFTRYGIIDTCYTFTDRFLLRNVKKFSNIHDGFHIDACNVLFARDTALKAYSLLTSGNCDSCGPDLKFTVLSPRYLDEEFSVFDKLDKPVRVTYNDSNQVYNVDFGLGPNHVSESNSKNIQYCGWNLGLKSYDFNENGLILTDFSVKLHEETFPVDKNGGDGLIKQFHGTQITGNSGLNDGALHLAGFSKAPGVNICSSNDYVFKAIDTLEFKPAGSYDYKMHIPQTCSLAVPSYKNNDFNENEAVTIPVMADTGFVLGPDGLEKVNASGDFVRSIGKKDSTGAKVFTINGVLDVSYAARDFQLKISSRGSEAIFIIDKSYFANQNDNVQVFQGSVGFFSDFTINTLYGKKEGGQYTVSPAQFQILNIPSDGFDIFKTSGGSTAGIRVLLLAPGFNLGDIGGLVNSSEQNTECNLNSSIYNAGFDLNGNLTNLSGRIELPEKLASCFGINGMSKISQQLAQFKLKTLYLGYENDTAEVFKVGADASITLGSIFNKIGLQGEKISLNKLTAGYSSNDWFLYEMHASAFPVPRLIGIGPRNFSDINKMESTKDTAFTGIVNDGKSGINYLELYTGGNGFRLDYESGENIKLDLKNWSLRITDKFPFKPLRGISFLLNEFIYEKKLDSESDGRITAFSAAAEYIPPGGSLKFGDVEFYRTRIKLGYDKETDSVDQNNNTSVNAYISIAFDSLRVGDKVFEMSSGSDECKTEFRLYFDGTFAAKGCLIWRDTIGIVPWGKEHDPKIFIDPGIGGTQVSVSIKSNDGFSAKMKGVTLRSKEEIEVLNTKLAVDVNELFIQFKDNKFCLKKLDVSWWIYKKLIDNEVFKLTINKVDFGYAQGKEKWAGASQSDSTDLKDAFWIITQPDVDFKLNENCEADIQPEIGLVVKTDAPEDEQRETKFIWKVNGNFDCEIGNMSFNSAFKINNDTIGFDSAILNMENLGEHFDDGDIKDQYENGGVKIGVDFYNVYWVKNSEGKWESNRSKGQSLNEKDPVRFSVIPHFTLDKTFNICGLMISGTFDFGRLFNSPYPGIGYKDISVTSKRLGNTSIPLFMSLYLDGRKPFIHIEPSSPKKIPIFIPSIGLTPDIQLGEAHMEFGIEQKPISKEETWYFKGDASMSLKGAVDKIEVKVAFEKPNPPKNRTGIRYAKIRITLAEGCRIPVGSTPLFISGFEGAIYDGEYMPDGAIACHIPNLPDGLKLEAAIFVELEDPMLLNGKVGFWVHLMQLNFGVNGSVKALRGIADANACLALYNNGQAFHGEFNTMIHMVLMSKGRFVIDIWKDETGGNFTADALSAIGLERGALIKKRFIKIPRKDLWFLELFAKAGKFKNEKNGLTTGLRFFGRTWGLGIIGGSFVIGDVGKYNLKQAPASLMKVTARGLAKSIATDAVMIPATTDNIRYINPGFELEGGEVISFTAATDSSSFEWPETVLRIVDAESKEMDLDSLDYIPFEGRREDTTKEYFINDENMVARLWVNDKNYDSILVAVPNIVQHSTDEPYGGFEYLFFAGLKPPRIDNISATADNVTTTHQVTFKGHLSDFQGHIRNIIRNDSSGVKDTLLRQKMDLKLYCSSISPSPSDTVMSKNYLHNFMEIPISQIDGYSAGDKSLLDNPNVSYDSINRTLSFDNLVWRTGKTAPGCYALRAAVEVTDFVTEDGEGNKTILPLNREDEASVFRYDPVVISSADSSHDTTLINIVSDRPISRPAGFTASGSESDKNWADKNERRSIFLRWHMDDNPAVHGYQIAWYPSNLADSLKNKLKRWTIIGKTDHYSIDIPDLTANDSLYSDNCDSAEGKAYLVGHYEIDSTIYVMQTDSVNADSSVVFYDTTDSGLIPINTIYFGHVTEYDSTYIPDSTVVTRPNRLCPDMIDTTYYKAKAFDVVITPVVNIVETGNLDDTIWVGRPQTIVKSGLKSDFADTLRNISLGVNTGINKNKFKIKWQSLSTPVDVPLNEGTVVKAKIIVGEKDTTDTASRYGEIWTRVINDSVPQNAMPKAGAFNNYFTVIRDTMKTSVSIRPVEKSMTCREMFSSTCSKRKIDLNGALADSNKYNSCAYGCLPDSSGEESCASCDSTYKNSDLKWSDPCNGNPDSIMIQRTPFDTYKMYLFAVNNGKRKNPGKDSIDYVVKDSLLFRVLPPKPVLHGVSPSYVLNNREDSLSLAVSGLWLDSSSAYLPAIKVRWYDKNGAEQYTLTNLTRDSNVLRHLRTGPDNRYWKLESNAEWEVRFSTKSIYIDTTGETKLYISIINRDKNVRGNDISMASNEFKVDYVFNPDSTECPDHFYSFDAPNSNYLMDWTGNYPADYLSPGDTVFVRFTELHDLDISHYSVKLLKGIGTLVDTTIITPIKVDYSGICFRLPYDLEITNIKKFRIVTKLLDGSAASKCCNKEWGSNISNAFSTVPGRVYEIVKAGNGFQIISTQGKQYRNLDDISYAVGKIPYSPELYLNHYDHESDPPQIVHMNQSNLVTAVIKRKSGMEYRIEKWIDIENTPELYDINGVLVTDDFVAEPGDKFFIRSPMQIFYDDYQTKPYHCYRFSECDSVIGDIITLRADSRGPLTIYRYTSTQPGTGLAKTQLEGFKTYNFTLRSYNKNEISTIILPSQRLLDAASGSVSNYPLLLRLDSTDAPNINTLLANQNFHFCNASMQPLPFEIEHIDTLTRTADIWVKMDTLNLGSGNNIVRLVSGTKANRTQDVWTNYRAVYHSNGDSAFYDATGNGFAIPASGSALIVPGLIDNSVRMSDQLNAVYSGKYIIDENDNGFTISTWIKINAFPASSMPLIRLINRKNRNEGSIFITSDSSLAFIMGQDTLKTMAGALESNVWLNVAATYDWFNSNGEAYIYINGLPVSRTERFNYGQRPNNISQISISSDGLDVIFDELRIAPVAFYRNRISLDYFSQRQRNDFLRAPDNITSVTSISASEYRMIPGAGTGDFICLDKNWKVESITPELVGKTWLLMPWSDRLSRKDTLVNIHLNGPAQIYLLLDSKYYSIPSFLDKWTETGRSISVEGPMGELGELKVYSMRIDSASDISFGGPRSGGAKGGELPWAVLMDLSQDKSGFNVSAGIYPYVRVSKAEEGELLFSDREHEIDSLPEALKEGILIQTSNAFRFSDTSSFVTLSVNRPSIANILLDTSYRSWPSFITNDKEWKSVDLRVKSGNKELSVLQKRIVNNDSLMYVFGGPHFIDGDGNGCSYALLLQPDNNSDVVRIITGDGCRINNADSGSIPYTDSLWHIIKIPGELSGKIMISTSQAKYACTDSVYLKIELLRSAWVYYVIDENQSKPPSFLTTNDHNGGRWELTTANIEISNHAKFRIYRKFLISGIYSFPCPRYDGSLDNDYNSILIIDTSRIKTELKDIPGIDPGDIGIADTGAVPNKDLPGQITSIPVEIKGLPFIIDSSVIDYCRHRTFSFDQPVRIWLAVDPSFQTSGTFMEYDGWEKTGLIIAISGGLKDRILWRKIFDPGTVTIPGVHCDYKQPGVMNSIIIIEYLEAPSLGLYSRNLKATGFGDERRTENDNYTINNLDVVYSYEIGMSSKSWIMNVETRSATADRGDTLKVLTPFENDTVYRINDTTVVRPGNRFYLAELMPVLVAADSVLVNAIDLRAQGAVRVSFKNISPLSVNTPFVVILFEDMNGDFVYNSYDKRLGSVTVNGIGAGETKLYHISLDDTLSFPGRTLLSFIDATEQIDEMDDWNNFGSSGTTCENYIRPVFVQEIGDSNKVGRWGHKDSLTNGLPSARDSTIFCYIKDFDGDSLIDDFDTLCIVYTYNNRLHAINALSHDSVFTSIFVGPSAVEKIRVDDYTNDGKPEIIAGNSMHDNNGNLIHDFTVFDSTMSWSSIDFNRDGYKDTAIWEEVDSCITARSGRDSTLLFVYPIDKWRRAVDPLTVSVLADIHYGDYNCYDVNVSFPRYSVTASDTVDLTIRVANAGSAAVKEVQIEMFSDTLDRDSTFDNLITDLPSGITLFGQSRTEILHSNEFIDFQIHAVLPDNIKRIWFRVDGENRYHECKENDNVLNIKIK